MKILLNQNFLNVLYALQFQYLLKSNLPPLYFNFIIIIFIINDNE